MSDTIYRQEAIDAIYEHEFSNWCDKDEVSTILNDLPSADRLQGEWIITEQDNGHKWTHRKCSECGKGVIEPLVVSAMKFCPNCGADMRGDKND